MYCSVHKRYQAVTIVMVDLLTASGWFGSAVSCCALIGRCPENFIRSAFLLQPNFLTAAKGRVTPN